MMRSRSRRGSASSSRASAATSPAWIAATASRNEGSAIALSSSSATIAARSRAWLARATSSGVRPLRSACQVNAPLSTSASTSASGPRRAAACSGVSRPSPRRGFAPSARSRRTASTSPARTAANTMPACGASGRVAAVRPRIRSMRAGRRPRFSRAHSRNTGDDMTRNANSATRGVAVPDSSPIEHVILLCMENRSFDHYLGALALPPHDRDVDGLTDAAVLDPGRERRRGRVVADRRGRQAAGGTAVSRRAARPAKHGRQLQRRQERRLRPIVPERAREADRR